MSPDLKNQSERPNLLLRGLYGLYGLWFVTVFTTLATGSLCLIAVAPGQDRRRRIAKSGASLLFRCTASYPRISGLELLPDEASVVVANHASYLDGVLLTAVLPHHYRFVIKREITQVPLVNFFLQRIGAHFVDRFDPRKGAADTRQILQTANSGASLAFFPEGTFTKEPGLRRFHNGAFTIAARNSLPLVPLTIIGTRHMLPAHSWVPIPGRLQVIISEPLHDTGTAQTRAVLQHCRELILQELGEPDLLATD